MTKTILTFLIAPLFFMMSCNTIDPLLVSPYLFQTTIKEKTGSQTLTYQWPAVTSTKALSNVTPSSGATFSCQEGVSKVQLQMVVYNFSPSQLKTYQLTSIASLGNKSYISYSSSTSVDTGSVTITKIDNTNQIIEGTFEARSKSGNSSQNITFESGSFRLKYTPPTTNAQ